MNDLQVFRNTVFGELNILVEDGKVLFPATESAKMIGYANPRKAILDHCKGVTKRDIPTDGGLQEMNFIPEGDLYRLITRSQLPTAEQFERWVFDEVLPSIRKTGSYSVQPAVPMSTEDMIILQAQSVKELKAKVDQMQATLATVNHRVDSLDATNIDGTPQQRLNSMVKKYAFDNGIIYSVGWSDFRTAFNNAYRTNLETRRLNYLAQHNLKHLTMPRYLTICGLIEDALRVADKMLTRQAAI